MLAKSATVCLPLVLIAGLRWLRGASWRVAIGRALPALAAAAVIAALVATVWNAHDMIPWARPDAAPIDVAATIATYGARTLVPTHLSPIYPAEAPHPVIGAIVVGLVLLAAALTWRRWPGVARFALWAWLAALAPTANLVPVWFRFADRYALLALYTLVVPLAIGLGALAHRLGRAPARIGLAVLALALAGEGIATATQVGVWHDSTTLWTHAVLAQPDARNALYKLGETRRDRGDWPGAIAAYQRAIRLDPDSPLGYAGLFYTYARRAEAQGAIAAGTADRWLAALGPALATPRAMAALLAEIPHAACAPCANLVLGLGLRQWPQPDAALLAAATDALDHGQPDVALVYLTSVRDPDAPAAAALIARARAASP
ncbi:MAG: tetratricopeptide repeat protein [Deltaproteobacteria bacterium]|nr:tetratricopeptide repeat protein [Deltaproteobacteria bacterium]